MYMYNAKKKFWKWKDIENDYATDFLRSIDLALQYKLQIHLLLVSGCAYYCQNVHEDVYNVQVQIKSSKNIFLWTNRVLMIAAHHKLSVVNEVNREEKCTDGCINQCNDFSFDEYGRNTENKEYDHSHK